MRKILNKINNKGNELYFNLKKWENFICMLNIN
uniref:Uncharacterized protein n=1 Tax=Anguilla anguilla TaxID=7936 RepID=A0A0E9RTJ3_ANGAN